MVIHEGTRKQVIFLLIAEKGGGGGDEGVYVLYNCTGKQISRVRLKNGEQRLLFPMTGYAFFPVWRRMVFHSFEEKYAWISLPLQLDSVFTNSRNFSGSEILA